MSSFAYILAEGDIGWLQIVVVAVILILGLISSVVQKAKEKEQQREGREKRRRPTPPTRQEQARRPQSAPQQVPPQPQDEEVVRVSEELRRGEQRQKNLEEARRRRLAVRKSPEADTAAIESRLLSVSQAGDGPEVEIVGNLALGLGLLTPDAARRAIVLHEILSPPKALRQGGESWDV